MEAIKYTNGPLETIEILCDVRGRLSRTLTTQVTLLRAVKFREADTQHWRTRG